VVATTTGTVLVARLLIARPSGVTETGILLALRDTK
jgi:hypothetical protein